ncbi:MAG: tetratricopeptide repeat protein, partial [Acidobacteriota bacterium]|nr:tetratricopeptide repeat protein [Acidobacteriota bacterium]
MYCKKQSLRAFFTFIIIWTFLINGLPAKGQDIPPTEELSLGSSVFLSRKTSPKKFVSRGSSRLIVKREKIQRVATVKKINRQYNTLAKVIKRRERIKIVAPENLPPDMSRIPADEASVILTGLGLYRYNRNEIDESIDAYRNSNRLDEKNLNAKLGLSDALAVKAAKLLEEDKLSDAENLLKEAIELNSENSAAYAGFGEFYEASEGDGESRANAIKNYEKALQIDKDLTEIYAPLGILYYKQGEIAKAEGYLTKALETSPNDVETQYFLGLIRYQQNNYKESEKAFKQAIKVYESSNDFDKLSENIAEAHFYLGEIYGKLDQPDDALVEYQKARKLNPKYVRAWFETGTINYNRGNYTEAVNAFKEVTRLKNDNWEGYVNLGDAYRKLGNWGEAEGVYRIAALFIKDDAELYSSYGFVLGAQNKWDGAITKLNSAVSRSPNVLDYTNLGWAYYNSAQADLRVNRQDDAVAKLKLGKDALQKAVALRPDFAPPYMNLGITLTDLGEYQAAVEAFTRATELRKNWVFAVNELGIAYRKLNDFDNAAKQFQKAVEIDDKYVVGYFNLGEAEIR